MACPLPPSVRDTLVRLFRAEVYRRTRFVEFPPQAEWRLATEGMELTDIVVAPVESAPQWPPDPKADHSLKPHGVKLLIACLKDDPGAFPVGETGNFGRYEWRLAIPRAAGVAHIASDLAAFKRGKSKGVGMWATGFACLPGATIDMVGLEYRTSEHEFDYLCDALLGGEKPLIPKSHIKHYYNNLKQGNMQLELTNGCSYEVRSYKNKDTLRGGQITGYIFNEVYQLPGLGVYTGHAQNLRAEQGYALFTSTPDEPWVKVLHEMGHGANDDWHCTCESNGFANPLTFSIKGFMADAPDWETIGEHAPLLLDMCLRSGLQPRGLMSKEKFLISWLGKLGGYVGRVYNFNRALITCTPKNSPRLWKGTVIGEYLAQELQLERLRGHVQA